MMEKIEKVLTRIIIVLFVVLILEWIFVWESPRKREYVPIQEEEEMELEQIIEEELETRVTVTVYNPVEEQCDSDPLITADGQKINLRKLNNGNLKWVAVSRDLLKVYRFGDKIRISSKKHPEINGIYEVHDVMHERHTLRIDILQPKVNGLYGKWNDVIISRA